MQLQDIKLAAKRYFNTSLNFLSAVIGKFFKDNCLIRASGLAYSSLLALVPLAATVFSLLNAFGALEQIQSQLRSFLFDQILPTRQDIVVEYIDMFLDNSTTLGFFGVLLFLFTSVFLLDNIHNNFNAVYRSSSKSNFVRKFTSYTSTLLFGSLFIAASFSITNILSKYIETLGIEEVSIMQNFIIDISPIFSLFLFFMLMILILPSTKVRLVSAFIGAASGALIWHLVQYWFVNMANTVIRMNVIYGSIASIPIFLFWLYLAWLIILIALEITYVHQHKDRYIAGEAERRHHPGFRASYSVNIYLRIADAFLKNEIKSLYEIIPHYYAYEVEIRSIISVFVKHGFLMPVSGQEYTFVPGKSLAKLTIFDIYNLFYMNYSHSPASRLFETLEVIIKEHLHETVETFLQNRSNMQPSP